MATIKEIIANKAQFPDDAKFTLAGAELTFGELRRQDAESQGELARQIQQREAAVTQRNTYLDQATGTLATILENVSAATGLTFEQLSTGQIPDNMRQTVADVTRQTTTTAGVPLKDDPLYKPLIDTYLQPLQNDLGIMKDVLRTSLAAYKNDRARLGWLEFMATERPEGFKGTYEEAIQLAVNLGLKDEVGFPDVRAAARRLASPIVEKTRTDKTFQEGVEAGKKQAQDEWLKSLGSPAASSPIAGVPFESHSAANPAQPISIKTKLEEAMKDPSIVQSLWGGMVQ